MTGLMILQKVSFSTVKMDDLKKAGVIRKRLHFEPTKVAELIQRLKNNAAAEIVIKALHSRIKRIYATVNMDVCRLLDD